jgi:hypothetical protein
MLNDRQQTWYSSVLGRGRLIVTEREGTAPHFFALFSDLDLLPFGPFLEASATKSMGKSPIVAHRTLLRGCCSFGMRWT